MIKNALYLKTSMAILIVYIVVGSVGLLRDMEDHPFRKMDFGLGFHSKHHWSFRQILENKERNGLRFTGYILWFVIQILTRKPRG